MTTTGPCAPCVSCRGIVHSFGRRRALDGIDLDIPTGSFFGLVGTNGAGKTTLMSIICGLLVPDAGTVQRIDRSGQLLDADRARRAIGLVPQELAWYPPLTVIENLGFFARMHGLAGARMNAAVARAVAIGRLEAVLAQRAETLSGGLKRRLNLAIGVLHRPDLLLLDEPTVGVDAQSRHHLQQQLKALNAAGTTIIYTSHDLDEVAQLCSELAVIDQGRLVAGGAMLDLLHEVSVSIRLQGPAPIDYIERLGKMPSVSAIDHDGERIELATTQGRDVLVQALQWAAQRNLIVIEAHVGPRSLKSLYFQLTGTRLRDGSDDRPDAAVSAKAVDHRALAVGETDEH